MKGEGRGANEIKDWKDHNFYESNFMDENERDTNKIKTSQIQEPCYKNSRTHF